MTSLARSTGDGSYSSDSRVGRRRQRSRAALVHAAQLFLADGRQNASIQELTDEADIGFGTFYTHFASKDELFEAALRDAIEAHGTFIDLVTSQLPDPAERFAVGVRVSCRSQQVSPLLVRTVLQSGTQVLMRDEGLVSRARADIEEAMAAGTFATGDSRAAVVFVGGALLGALQLLDQDGELDADDVATDLTWRMLCALGMEREQAKALAIRSLDLIPADAGA